MANVKNIENHKFKKGQSGNPKGRPPKLPEIDALLSKVLGAESGNITAAEKMLQALYRKALKGDVRAAEILLDRGYGKVKQDIGFKGELGLTWNETKTYDTIPTADKGA